MRKPQLPSQDTINEYHILRDKLNDPNSCIDDSEELLNDIPTYLSFILALHYELMSTRNQLTAIKNK